MNKIFEIFNKTKIIPVITIEDAANAVPLAGALLKGGIKIAEITYRTDAAPKAISELSAHCPDVLAGAGTGRMPWAHFTVPLPVATGAAAMRAGAR